MFKFFKERSLGAKLSIIVAVVLGLVMIVEIVLLNESLGMLTAQTSRKRLDDEVAVIRGQFVRAESEILTNARFLMTTPGLVEAVAAKDVDEIRSLVLVNSAPLNLSNVYVTDTDGARLLALQPDALSTDEDNLLSLSLLGVEATADIVIKSRGGRQISLLAATVPLRDRLGSIVGALMVSRRVDDAFLADVNFSREGVHLALADESEITAQTEATGIAPDQDMVQRALGGETVISDAFVSDSDGVPHGEAYIPLAVGGGGPEAVVVTRVDLSDFFLFRSQLTRVLTVVFLLLGLVVAGVVVLFIRRSITIPLGQLRLAAEIIAAGDLDATAPVVHDDEVGALARAFNNMTSRLKTTLGQVAEERNLLRTLIDTIPDSIFVRDTKGTLLVCNTAHARVMGAASPEVVVGKTLDNMPPHLAAKFAVEERAIIESGEEQFDRVERLPIPGGVERWISSTKVPLKDSQGNIAGLVGVMRDITERKQVDEALRESRQLLQLVLDNIPQSIFWKDRDLVYLGCNRRFAEEAGLDSPGEIASKTDFDMPWAERAEQRRAGDAEVIEANTPKLNVEEPRHLPDGEIRWFRTSTIPLPDADGNVAGVLGSYEDITVQKEAIEALRINEETLKAAVGEYLEFAQRVAQGDLTARLDLNDHALRQADLYRLSENLNLMVGGLSDMTRQVRQTASRVSGAATEIMAAATQQMASAAEQEATVAQTAATTEEVQATVTQTTEHARSVAGVSRQSVEVSRAGQDAVTDTIEGMRLIRERVEAIAENILVLSERTQQVGDIVASVNEIAEQSKMLALNASIEAARAGEEGRGFAVVAAEIRQLAEQSRTATTQVRDLLDEIRQATNTAVMVTEEGAKGADGGVVLVERAGEAIRNLAATIENVAQAATQIAASAHQQTNGMEQLSVAMMSIKQASAQTVSSTRQAESSAQDLLEMARQMEQAAARYRLH